MIKKFGDKKITIRKLSNKDLKQPEKFQDFLNSLIEEDAMILMNTERTKKEEFEWLKSKLSKIRKKKEVALIAVCDGMIVGKTSITLESQRKSHIGGFGIGVKQGYRGIGLGEFLMKEIIKLAKKELKPKPKIIQMDAFFNNKPARRLYKKMGFKEVAIVPKEYQLKGQLTSSVIMVLEI